MATITEDYVSFEVAKLLKEKGFDIPCDYAYNNKAGYFEVDRSNFDEVYCFRHSLAMAMKWLREVHNTIIIINPSVLLSDNLKWIASIRTFNKEEYYLEDQGIVGKYNTYKEACEKAIKYYLENLI